LIERTKQLYFTLLHVAVLRFEEIKGKPGFYHYLKLTASIQNEDHK